MNEFWDLTIKTLLLPFLFLFTFSLTDSYCLDIVILKCICFLGSDIMITVK